jgi:prepilin-type N-terminal cleavage/methylation domain-containing protein
MHTNQQPNQARMRKQKGFTLVEIVIVLVLLGTIIAVIGVNLSESQDDVLIGTTGLWLEKNLPEAIGKYRVGAGSCSGITKAALTGRGLDGNTSWGEAWSISLAGTDLTLTYPLGSSPDKATIGAQLTTRMGSNTNVSSASYADPNLTVVYNCT